MIRLTFVNKDTGVVAYVAEMLPGDITYKDGDIVDNFIVKLDGFSHLLSEELCRNYYYKNNEFKQLPTKPSQYHIWNLQTEQWEEPDGYLQTIQSEGNKQINQLSSQKILSKYPIYKQLNIGRTPEAQVMYDWIDNVRNLSNIATANITQAVTQDEITTIVDNFKTELGNIV